MEHPLRPLAAALRLLLPAALMLALIALVLGALGGGALWLGRSEDGTRWLLARLPGVQVEGLRGALLGRHVEADRVQVAWGGGTRSLTITGFVGDGLRWTWHPQPGVWAGLDADRLAARRIELRTGAPSGTPPTLPSSLALPVRVRVAALRIDELAIDALAPLRAIDAKLALGDGDRHAVDALRFDWDRLRVQGAAAIGASAPFAVGGTLQIAPASGDAFAATLRAGGTLARVALEGRLRGRVNADAQAGDSAAAPAADLQAVLQPFAPWPLESLQAQTAALDLAALASAAPQTRLSGHATLRSSSKDAPIGASIELDNALPGRWNERRLPLRHLTLELQARVAQRDRVELPAFEVELGGTQAGAGRWRGRGEWRGDTLQLDSRLEAVRPQQLDGRAAAMTLSGPLALTLRGLPPPDGSAPAGALTVAVKSTLDGRLDAAPQPVQLTLDASAGADRIELRALRAQAGAAVAQLSASARRIGSGTGTGAEVWQVASSGSLADFDPRPWWPGEAGSAWRQGPHRLSAGWQLDLRVPAGAVGQAPLALLPRLAGRGMLNVHDSLLAGVPLALDLELGQAPSAAGTPSSLHGELRLGANRVVVDGRGNPAGDGSSDHLQFDLDAPALAALAPLLRLDPALAAWAPKAGSAKAGVTVQGRWPNLRSEGRAELLGLDAGTLGIARGSASWQVDIDAEGRRPLALKAELGGVRLGGQRAEQLRAELSGTLREHRLLVSGALPLTPPPLAEQLLGVSALAGTRAQLQAEGRWQPEAAGGGRWSGHVTRLAVGAWDGGALAGETRASWLAAADLSAELAFDAAGNLQRVQAAPGRLTIADAVALRWDEVQVDLRGAAPKIELRANVDAFALAPLLARAQPAIGWGGDLTLAARLEVHAAERFDADVVFERKSGDLQIRDETGTQTLGLTDLRLALAAHDGTWYFTQALAGRSLGELAGALRVTTTPQQRWPRADAPIDGVLQARVANLGVWGGWVPPGWRLAGELVTSASVGGRFGAPEYTGEVRGTDLGVRNLLLGVNVSQGQVAIALKGASAQIERFTLKGGDGTLTLTGGAEFGAAPNAHLKLAAEHFRVLGRIDRQLIASGSAELALQADRVALDGRFGVDEGLFDTSRGDAPGLDDDVTVRRAGDAEPRGEAAPAPRPRRNIVVDVDVDLGERLRVRGRGLDTALRGRLHITTPGGRLAVAGTVNTEGGTYAAYGQKLDIERGIVAFSGAVDNPRLDILALRPNVDMRVGVQISGNLLTPRVRLYAENDMSDTDKLSWLVLGRAPDGLGRTDTALLQRAAVALLSGENGAPTDGLMRNLGLDELTLRQSEGDVRETVISLGKQLSRRWYVGYERGVNATTGTFQLIYRIAQRFTLRAQSGQENSLDVIWTWKFDDAPRPARVPKSAPTPP